MITPPEKWLLDTNVWIFGLRQDTSHPACARLLDCIGLFSAFIPLQVLHELNLALTEDEVRYFYRLVNQYSEAIELSWERAPLELIHAYERRGCRKGDAVIAAHAETSETKLIVSENRQFLQILRDVPVEIVSAAEAQLRLKRSQPDESPV